MSHKICKSTLLNIDSEHRDIYPKHICSSDGKILPLNPLTLTIGSDIININYPNHNLNLNDEIIIQNVEGISRQLIDSFYLVNNLKYLIIYYGDGSDMYSNYKQFVEDLYINIELVGEQTEKNNISNIQFNSLLGIKRYLLYTDISDTDLVLIKDFFQTNFSTSENYRVALYIELSNDYIDILNSFIKINQIFKISYLHIGGVKLGYLNANYPINNYNYQKSYFVYNVVDNNTIQFQSNYQSYGTIQGGGKNVQVMKILDSIIGYPDADNYVINLKKSFTNVVNIELVSSEIPYIDLLIKKNENDKLYWKQIEDGNHIYSVVIDEGFYTPSLLLKKLSENINLVPRITSTITNPIYNNFDIIFEDNLQKITFKPYNLSKLVNSISCHKEIIDSTNYYILTIKHFNNLVEIGDIITISDSTDITYKNNLSFDLINSSYINKDHTIYNINLKNQTYDIILGSEDQIELSISQVELKGGPNTVIKSKTKTSFLFNKLDTFGDILGFKYVGDNYSIIDYNSIITNQDTYIYSNNLDFVGNENSYSNGFLNLVGKYNYILMYLNDIEYIYNHTNTQSAFAKILLSGNPGDILFNTYVALPSNIYSKTFPISTLTNLTIRFTYPDGNRINFRNINHSFTLKITEEQIQINKT